MPAGRRIRNVRSPIPAARDYYWSLGVGNNASPEDITKAYRRLACRWHPAKNAENKLLAEKNFQDVSEAYQILSNPMLRMMYDKFGRDGLVPDDAGLDFEGMVEKQQVYPFREAMAVYREFFGDTDPRKTPTAELSFDPHAFQHCFPGFPRPAQEIPQPPPNQNGLTLYKGYIFSGPTDDDDFRSHCVTTKIFDGHTTVTNRQIPSVMTAKVILSLRCRGAMHIQYLYFKAEEVNEFKSTVSTDFPDWLIDKFWSLTS